MKVFYKLTVKFLILYLCKVLMILQKISFAFLPKNYKCLLGNTPYSLKNTGQRRTLNVLKKMHLKEYLNIINTRYCNTRLKKNAVGIELIEKMFVITNDHYKYIYIYSNLTTKLSFIQINPISEIKF